MLTFILILLISCVFIYFIAKLIYVEKYGIEFVCAEIGAGKTCYSVKKARQYLKKGWHVVSNEPIVGCYYDPDMLNHMCQKKYYPDNTLLIYDESAIGMNSRSYSKTPLRLIEGAKKIRHAKCRLILISQTFTDTDKQLRELCENIYIIRKLIPTKLSMPVKVHSKIGTDDLTGDIVMKYKIGHVGIPYFLPFYYNKFNSYSVETTERYDLNEFKIVQIIER